MDASVLKRKDVVRRGCNRRGCDRRGCDRGCGGGGKDGHAQVASGR